MTNPQESALRIYEDVLNAPSFTHSWLPEHTFPVGNANVEQREQLRKIAGIEVHFESLLAADHEFLEDLVITDGRACFLYTAEPISAPQGRLRSYRGLFNRVGVIKRSHYVEVQIPLRGNYTHFAGVVRVTRENIRECAIVATDSQRSFLLLSDHDRASEDFARLVLLQYGPRLPGSNSTLK